MLSDDLRVEISRQGGVPAAGNDVIEKFGLRGKVLCLSTWGLRRGSARGSQDDRKGRHQKSEAWSRT